MAYNNSVRKKLIEIMDQGLMLKAITRNTGIDGGDLSRYKKGMDCLREQDIKTLSTYLNGVVIPQWNIVAMNEQYKDEKKKSTRDLLFM